MDPIEELRIDSIEYLRAETMTRPIGVDRGSRVIRGVVLAQEGPFRTRRGAFTQSSLQKIKELAAIDPNGLACRLGHPDPATGKRENLSFVGRVKNPYIGTVDVIRNRKPTRLDAVRGDLHLNPTIFLPAPGAASLGERLLGFAETDHGSMSGSLVLTASKTPQLNSRGRPIVGEDGQPLPPLWGPISIMSWDLVDLGDAADSLLGCLPVATDADAELMQMKSRNEQRRAELLEPDAELLRLRWQNTKRKAGVL